MQRCPPTSGEQRGAAPGNAEICLACHGWRTSTLEHPRVTQCGVSATRQRAIAVANVSNLCPGAACRCAHTSELSLSLATSSIALMPEHWPSNLRPCSTVPLGFTEMPSLPSLRFGCDLNPALSVLFVDRSRACHLMSRGTASCHPQHQVCHFSTRSKALEKSKSHLYHLSHPLLCGCAGSHTKAHFTQRISESLATGMANHKIA